MVEPFDISYKPFFPLDDFDNFDVIQVIVAYLVCISGLSFQISIVSVLGRLFSLYELKLWPVLKEHLHAET